MRYLAKCLVIGIIFLLEYSLQNAVAVTSTAMYVAQRQITVPAGTPILVRTTEPVDSSKQKSGDRFTVTLETDLKANNLVVAERGTTVYGRLATAKSAGRFKGSSQLTLELTDIVIGGNAYPILTSTYEFKGSGEGKKTSRKILGGAGLGTVIGGIAGG